VKILFDPSKDSLLSHHRRELEAALYKNFKLLRADVSSKEHWNAITKALQSSLIFTSAEAYRLGALQVGRSPISYDYIKLRRDAMARGAQVVHDMRDYTHRSLGILAGTKSTLLGSARAQRVAIYETRKSAFSAKSLGWALNNQAKKSWAVSNEHDQDDTCDDNEDDGIIPMSEAFTSGDFAPPAHINCLCTLFLHM
jgi:hypothetical protein